MAKGIETTFLARPLGDIAEAKSPIVYGIVQPGEHIEGGVPFVQSRDVGSKINLGDLQNTSQKIAAGYKRSSIKTGDILFSLRGDIGASSIAPVELDGANIARGIARIRVRGGYDRDYVRYALQAPEMQRVIARNANGSTFRELSIEEIRKLLLPVPPLPEQRKIAEILRTWDDAIEKLTALRTAKLRLYSTLADGLIFGTLRLGNNRRDWTLRRLAEVTREITARNHDGKLGRDKVMGVTNSRGIVPMRQQTIGGDLTKYKILPPRAFAYNPMRINVGSIAMLKQDSDVLVSPDYVLFECVPGGLDPDFLAHLRQSHFWDHYINAGGSGSVRMRTYYDDLAALRLKLPDYDEQLAISSALNTANDEISLIAKEIDALTRQKRGLMQKLLTGEWRVKVEGAP